MGISKSGDVWTVEVENGVMIWEFRDGVELSPFRDGVYPVCEKLLEAHDISGTVTHVDMADPFNADTFEVWAQSALTVDRAGQDRWEVAADGITVISLGGKIDTSELDTLTTEARTEAVEWTKAA